MGIQVSHAADVGNRREPIIGAADTDGGKTGA